MIDRIKEIDVIILGGGVPLIQIEFFQSIHLREKLVDFDGIVMAWSAGSMNCADVVFNFHGGGDGNIPGLGLTTTNIIPHFDTQVNMGICCCAKVLSVI